MSGFVAVLNSEDSPVDVSVLRRLTDFLAFRGPDARQVWSAGPVGFGHTLLRATREAEHEQQPMSLDGKVWIVADARLDARKELFIALARESSNGPTATLDVPDAELILRAYLAWGEDCVEHLLGDFAFVIWDVPRRRLFAARDQFGMKPLFYAQAGGALIASNTLDCIRQHPAVSERLNDLAIADFLIFDVIREPSATAFADIQRLPPAHVLRCEQERISIRRYWTLSVTTPIQYRRDADYVEHFRELLDTTVADRLRTDRVGVFMSGGMDSPTVAASARRVSTRNGNLAGLRAYTDVFDRLIPYEERHYATLVAEMLKIPIEFRASDDWRIFELAESHSPEPVHSAGPDPTWYQLRQVAASSRVVLTGLGADPALSSLLSVHFRELVKKTQLAQALADAFRYLRTEGRLSRLYIGKRLRRWFPSTTSAPSYAKWLNPDFEQRLGLRQRWEGSWVSPAPNGAVRPIAQEQMLDAMWPSLFERYDAGTTGVPVDVRHPFFDLRLVNFLLALPAVPWCCDKELLREAARGTLPDAVRLRRKSPLPADPLVALLQKSESAWVDHFEPCPEIERYVLRQKIPAVFGERDSWSAWVNLRPLSLNFWLRGIRPSALSHRAASMAHSE